MSKGGGGGGAAQGYQYQQTQLPDWVQGPAQQAVGMAQQLAARPTQVNPYEQIAPLSGDTQQSFQQIRAMQGATDPYYQAAGQGYLNLAPLAAGVTPGQITSDTQALLNPYTQAVIDPAVQQMRQGLAQNLQTVDANAANVGAFGGTRQGVMEGVARAQEAQNEASLVSQLYNNQWNNAASQAFDLSKLNMGAGMTALQQLPGFATSMQSAQARDAGLLAGIGDAQQRQDQSQYDIAASKWAEAQNYPVQNLDILLGTLTGTPYGTTTQGYAPQPQAQSNVAGQVMGGIGTAASVAGSIAAII